jgi:hypothetical protein
LIFTETREYEYDEFEEDLSTSSEQKQGKHKIKPEKVVVQCALKASEYENRPKSSGSSSSSGSTSNTTKEISSNTLSNDNNGSANASNAQRKSSVSSTSSNVTDDIFTRGTETYAWLLKFHTIDRPKKSNSKKQLDETVSFQIIGDYGQSQVIKLKNKGSKLFQAGQIDSFDIKTKKIGAPKYVILSINGTHTTPKWHLDRVSFRLQVYFRSNNIISNLCHLTLG